MWKEKKNLGTNKYKARVCGMQGISPEEGRTRECALKHSEWLLRPLCITIKKLTEGILNVPNPFFLLIFGWIFNGISRKCHRITVQQTAFSTNNDHKANGETIHSKNKCKVGLKGGKTEWVNETERDKEVSEICVFFLSFSPRGIYNNNHKGKYNEITWFNWHFDWIIGTPTTKTTTTNI